ncbi:MAG TPA: malate synthase A [Kineosporiaceae bacterium]|nr:malate synthase A [Kineosporiaceae bacterium]
MTATAPTARVLPGTGGDDDVLTPQALALIATLHRTYDHGRQVLLRRRAERAAAIAAGEPLRLPEQTAAIRNDATWQVPPAPADLADRRTEITGPAERKMMVSALTCGAKVFMCDLEDALSPTWRNIVEGHRNLRDHATGRLEFTRPDGTVQRITGVGDPATLVVRPRGLHLPEPRIEVDGARAAASIVDLALAATLTGPARQAAGSALYLYLPKLESRHEAELWDALIGDVERRVGLAPRSVRVSLLIETLPAAFEMDEILFALRGRATALNAGRWDYLFSVIKKLGADPAHVLPDRGAVTMAVPFMAAYAQRLVAVCHARGAHAIGGMSAFIPDRRQAAVTERAFAQVRLDKQREAGLGYDGTWVAHPDLVPVAVEAFDAALGANPNQLDFRPEVPPDVATLLDTSVPGARVTLAGVRTDVSVGVRYLVAWLGGRGAAGIDNLMEDLATAEISRSQLWQWIQHAVPYQDGDGDGGGGELGRPGVVDIPLVEGLLAQTRAELVAAGEQSRLVDAAIDLLRQGALSARLPEFLSLLALDRLDELHRLELRP